MLLKTFVEFKGAKDTVLITTKVLLRNDPF